MHESQGGPPTTKDLVWIMCLIWKRYTLSGTSVGGGLGGKFSCVAISSGKIWKDPYRVECIDENYICDDMEVLHRGGSIVGSSTALQFSKWSFFILQPVQVLFYSIQWTFGFTFYILKKTNFTAKFYQGNLTYEVPCYILATDIVEGGITELKVMDAWGNLDHNLILPL